MLSADFVEREYNLRSAFPDHPQWFARWAADSAAARERLVSERDLRYGSGPRQTLDLFPAERAQRALLFIHGGYWRGLDKDHHSFVAPPLVERGIGVAVINYDLCPDVGIGRIVEECRQAVAWLWREGASHGVPADRLFVAGHSAGGHLAAMLYATDWRRYGVPIDTIRGGVAISGVFDLEPLLQVSFNADLKLDRGKARALSPIHCQTVVRAPLLLAVGSGETSEFGRQSWLMWERWPDCRPPDAHGPLFIADRHHYSVLSDLGRADSALTRAMLAVLRA
ncbi:MAG TPA: alpha/beta hydrolase [Casimicrobiaceae bacterium]|nr:alpha/beta hydrolase [Casimicrobiaceae bacterium]